MAYEWTTLAIVKSEAYLGLTGNTFDTALTQLIQDVTTSMIDYLDDATLTPAAPADVFKVACAIQVAYEFKRRKDKGLSNVQYQDGSVAKFDIQEWLPDVKEKLSRNRHLEI